MTVPGPTLPARRRNARRWFAAGLAVVGLSMVAMAGFRLYVTYLGVPVRVTIDGLAVVSDNDGVTYRAAYHYDLAGRTHRSKATVSDRLRRWMHDAASADGSRGVVDARAVPLPGGRAYCMLEDGPLTWLMAIVGGGATAVAAGLGRRCQARR